MRYKCINGNIEMIPTLLTLYSQLTQFNHTNDMKINSHLPRE